MNDHVPEPRWSDYAAKIAGLLVLGVTLWGLAPDALVGTYVQDGLNVVLAKALVLGEGFRLVHVHESPAVHGVAPLYPWFVSVLGRVWPFFPENLLLMQIASAAMLGAAAWILGSSLQRAWAISPWLIAAATVVGFANVPVMSLAMVPFAEPLALFCLASAVALATADSPRWWTGAAVGLMAGAATLASVAVAPAAIGIGLGIGVRGRFRASGSALAVVAAVLVIWWLVWGTGPAGSVNIGGLDIRTTGDHLGAVWRFFPSVSPLILLLPLTAFVGFALWGSATHWRIASVCAFVLLGLALSGWLWSGVSHRLWPMTLPWICPLAALGAASLWARFSRARLITGIATAGVIAVILPHNVFGALRQFRQELDQTTQPVRYLLSTTVAELPGEAIISTDVAELLYLYTDRHTIPWWLESAAGAALGDFRDECERGVTHVAVSGLQPSRDVGSNDPATNAHLRPVFELTDGPSLYELQCRD